MLILRILCFIGVIFAAAAVRGDEPDSVEFFEKRIRPVLVNHCYECHSEGAVKQGKLKGGLLLDSRQALLTGGDSGAAVVPGEVDESLLLSALRYDDYEMPPKGRLPANVIDDFTRWVEAGAVDPRDQPSAAVPKSLDLDKGREHWAYQLPVRSVIPAVKNAGWVRNDIDAFILAKLEQRGWQPAPDASPEVLIRRLYYDLTGLPPSPAEIERFVADPSPQRYEALVDQLLASPRFGERWGRHWLDVARFGESNTLRGTVFPQAWRYRDWVIDAFNRDLPFDKFVQLQVAGDLLDAADRQQRRRQLVATTLLAIGNTNFENQDKQQLRMDVVDEQLETIGRAFLAQTIACARCHDHKFDPIPTRDYYALAGILRNTKTLEHANVSRWLEVPLPADPQTREALEQHETLVAELQQQIATIKKSLGPQAPGGPKSVSSADLPGLVLDDVQAVKKGDWTDSTFSAKFVDAGYIHDSAQGRGEKSVTFEWEVPRDGEYEVRVSYATGSNRATKVPVTVWYADGGSRQIHINQRRQPPIDGLFISLGVFTFKQGEPARVVIANDGVDGHVIVDAVQCLPQGKMELAASRPDEPTPDQLALQAELKELEAELKKVQAAAPPREMAMTVMEEEAIGDTKIHIRGNVHNLGGDAPRGFLQVAHYEVPPEFTDEESGRRQLGEWLASEKNPLTARVAVNRMWHWLFGAGIVRTTDNFGTVGELPSHPELLDYLALEFQDDGWSVKSILRKMVLSRTYQMSSALTRPARGEAVGAADTDDESNRDVDNRLLWRMNRKRLEAECLRDAMLRVSGRLSLDMYGATYPEGRKEDYDFQYQGTRRSVYVPVFRNALPEIFEVFDFANPSMVVGRRSTSTVAPQALFMMNNPFVIDQARAAAERLQRDLPAAGTAERVEWAFRATLGRSPSEQEQRVAVEFVEAESGSSAERPAQRDPWPDLIQALFASMDFRYVD